MKSDKQYFFKIYDNSCEYQMNKYMNSTNNLSVMRSDFKEKFPLEKNM